jgi:hypothetical protein
MTYFQLLALVEQAQPSFAHFTKPSSAPLPASYQSSLEFRFPDSACFPSQITGSIRPSFASIISDFPKLY